MEAYQRLRFSRRNIRNLCEGGYRPNEEALFQVRLADNKLVLCFRDSKTTDKQGIPARPEKGPLKKTPSV
jgi:hypothetical protein